MLTCSFRIFVVNSVDDLRIRRLAEVPGESVFKFKFYLTLITREDITTYTNHPHW